MITYQKLGFSQFAFAGLSPKLIFCLLRQPSIVRCLVISISCGMCAIVIKVLDDKVGMNFLPHIMPDESTYSSWNFLLGFFICFHACHAYQRFIAGGRIIYSVMGSLVDMASLFLAFTRSSMQPREHILKFKSDVIRLSSVLFAVLLAELEGGSEARAFACRMIDPKGLGDATLERIIACKSKAHVVGHMIQTLIVDHIASGVLSVPAPILTRAFQEHSNVMIHVQEARSFCEVPFPFPYVVVSEALLLFHWVSLPFFMSQWCQGWKGAGGYTFLVAFTLWTLHSVAMELDNPFGHGVNDLDMIDLQEELNEQLLDVFSESNLEFEVGEEHQLSCKYARADTISLSINGISQRLNSMAQPRLSLGAASARWTVNSGESLTSERRDSRHSRRSSGESAASAALPTLPEAEGIGASG